MFDENHRLILQPFRHGLVENQEIKMPSDGEYEGGILCSECDNNLLGHYYEDYASRVMYGGQLLEHECPLFQNCISQHGIKFIKCQRVNYHKYKLFLLSILWRASISKRPFFSEVNLELEHEAEIRRMILTKDAGEVSKYPIFICTYLETQDLPKQLIAQPRLITHLTGSKFYSFMINGYFYDFYVNDSSVKLPNYVTAETIKPNNELNVNILPEDRAANFVYGQFGLRKR